MASESALLLEEAEVLDVLDVVLACDDVVEF